MGCGGRCVASGGVEVTAYLISIRFDTSRPISEEELGRIMDAVAVQVEEPFDNDSDCEESFATSHVEIMGGEA